MNKGIFAVGLTSTCLACVLLGFGLFGVTVNDKDNINNQLQQENTQLKTENELLLAQLEPLAIMNEDYKNAIQMYETQIALYKSQLKSASDYNIQLTKQIEELEQNAEANQEEIAELQTQQAQNQTQIEELNASIVELNSKNNVLNEQLEVSNARIEELVAELNAGNELFEKLVSGEITEITAQDLNGVTEIRPYAFYGCENLVSVELPESITSIGMYAFNGCVNLSSINLPNQITKIENYAFADCSSLQALQLPNSLTIIGTGAFNRCERLQSITIPELVTEIGSSAFNGCTSLQTMTVLADTPPTLVSSSALPTSLTAIYVKDGNVEAYQGAKYWSSYKDNIYPIDAVRVTGITDIFGESSVLSGETLQLTVDVIPSNAYRKDIVWSSSNTTYAKVDSTGLVTAVKGGAIVTITAKTVDGEFIATKEIDVLRLSIPDSTLYGTYKGANLTSATTNTNSTTAKEFVIDQTSFTKTGSEYEYGMYQSYAEDSTEYVTQNIKAEMTFMRSSGGSSLKLITNGTILIVYDDAFISRYTYISSKNVTGDNVTIERVSGATTSNLDSSISLWSITNDDGTKTYVFANNGVLYLEVAVEFTNGTAISEEGAIYTITAVDGTALGNYTTASKLLAVA